MHFCYAAIKPFTHVNFLFYNFVCFVLMISHWYVREKPMHNVCTYVYLDSCKFLLFRSYVESQVVEYK